MSLLQVTSGEVDDALGRARQITNSDGSIETITYDAAGNKTEDKLVQPSTTGVAATVLSDVIYGYDALGRLDQTEQITGSSTSPLISTTTYTQGGGLDTVVQTAPSGGTTTTVSDSSGDPVSVTEWAGGTATPLVTAYAYSYNASAGTETTTTTDPSGLATSVTTNAQGLELSSTNALGNTVSTDQYDTAGRLIKQTDAYGNVTTNVYGDPATGQVTETIAPNQTAATGTRFAYDSDGNLVSLTDPDGYVTQTSFDGLGRETSETNDGTWSYGPDTVTHTNADGNITVTTTNPATDTTTETWYAPGDTSLAHPLRTIITVTDADGNPTSITETGYPSTGTSANSTWQTLSTWTAAYNEAGEMTGSTQSFYVGGPTGGTMSPLQTFVYGYNADEVQNSMSLALGGSTTPAVSDTYGVDNLDDVTSVTQVADGRTLEASESLLADGRINNIVRSEGTGTSAPSTVTTAAFQYDSDGELKSQAHTDASGSALTSYNWTYDNNEQVTQQTYTRTAGTAASTARDYTYDSSGQVATVNGVAVNGGTGSTPNYDPNGNTSEPGTSVGPFNELLNDGTFTYTYDAAGNRLTRTADAGVTGVPAFTAYTYDNHGNMTSVTESTAAPTVTGSQLVEQVYYNYDVFDQRVGETVVTYTNGVQTGGVSTGYIYDGTQVLAELSESGATAGTVTRTNLWLPGSDELMASDLGTGSSAVTVWPLFDNEGTINDLFASNGTSFSIGESVTFDTFGNVTATTISNTAVATFGLYYASHQLDSQTGLYYEDARWYDPFTHQFTQQDPTGFAAGDTNLYRDVGNSQPNFTDPTGLADIPNTAWPYRPGAQYANGRVSNDGMSFVLNSGIKDNSGYFRKTVPLQNGTPVFNQWSEGDVEIAIIGVDKFDQSEAAKAFKAKYGRLPSGNNTFHHDGQSAKTVIKDGKTFVVATMQSVPSELNAAVPHNGAAATARAYIEGSALQSNITQEEANAIFRTQAREFNASARENAPRTKTSVYAGAFTFFMVYTTLRDAAISSGATNLHFEETGERTYYYRDVDGSSVFIVKTPGDWDFFGSPHIKYIFGPKAGTTVIITKDQAMSLEKAGEALWGKYTPGTWTQGPSFQPGSLRSTLPLFKTSPPFFPQKSIETEGWIDSDGIHYYEQFDPRRNMA